MRMADGERRGPSSCLEGLLGRLGEHAQSLYLREAGERRGPPKAGRAFRSEAGLRRQMSDAEAFYLYGASFIFNLHWKFSIDIDLNFN